MEKLKKYARLLVETALALQQGQCLYIEAVLEAEEFVCLVAETALAHGASDVQVRWMSNRLDRVRMTQSGCTLEMLGAEQAKADWVIDRGGCLLRLEAPDMTAFAGVDPVRLQIRSAGEMRLHGSFRTRGTAQNVIACVATKAWARFLFPELPEEEGLDRLWDCILGAVMADRENPAQAWEETIRETNRHRRFLNEKQYTRLHITGRGTDLYLGMPREQSWDGGGVTTPEGVFFLPNLPSYEVFTSPKADTAEGTVAATLPLNYQGGLIREIQLTFRNGRVTGFHAEEGEELLRQILEADEGSSRLGEVAIVPHGSPVERQGIIFYTTVCDENAACHLALGNGFCREGRERAQALGINQSAIHVDFMIGGTDTCIQGERADGQWENILVNGAWVI